VHVGDVHLDDAQPGPLDGVVQGDRVGSKVTTA